MDKLKSSEVKFKINGVNCVVHDEYGPDVSLNDYIRNVMNLKGTKVMCHEGGCGACIVSAKYSNGSKIFSINSCLIPVLACHGWEITTVEGIGDRRKGYHPVQKCLARFNGTQCGYCTPGWVMSMYSLLQNTKKGMTMKEIENSFAANICRCTGYRAISDAFKTFATDAEPRLLKKVKDLEDLNTVKGCNIKCAKVNCCKQNKIEKHSSIPMMNVDSESEWCFIDKENLKEDPIDIQTKDGHNWIKVYNLQDAFSAIENAKDHMLIAGSTGHGVYHISDYPETLIDISNVDELKSYVIDLNLVLGAGMTLTDMMNLFVDLSRDNEDFFYLHTFYEHMDLVAHIPVRNVGTIAGNLMLKHEHLEFQSDVFLLFELVGATMSLLTSSGKQKEVTMMDFLKTDMKNTIILNVKLPPLWKKCCLIKTYKVMLRAQNAHAIVNAGVLLKYNESFTEIQKASIVFGSISPIFSHATNTESFLEGKDVFNNEILQLALKSLEQEIHAEENQPEPSAAFRKHLAICLFYKAVIALCPESIMSEKIKSGGEIFKRGVSQGVQSFDTNKSMWPVGEPLPKVEAIIQTSGEALFANDLETLTDEVYAAFVLSTVPTGTILSFNPNKALERNGVLAFYSYKDIPGENTFTPTVIPLQIENEEILCSGKVLYHGQPIGIIVAKTEKLAKKAAELVEVQYNTAQDYKPILTIKEALRAPDSKMRVRKYNTIDPTETRTSTKTIIKGEFNVPGQYHYTMETLTAIARPVEQSLEVHASTQWLGVTHFAVANCLGVESSKIDILVRRLGGGFGIKLTRAVQTACAAAIVSFHLNKTCRFVLPMETNVRAVGKRFPGYCKFEVGVNERGLIQYGENNFYNDYGSSSNENITMFAIGAIHNCYDPSPWKIVSYTVLTDNASNTWFRGPGTTEAIAFAEYIMEKIAHQTKQDAIDIRLLNIADEKNALREMINQLRSDSDYDNRKKSIETFNKENRWRKRAIKLLPMQFPIKMLGNYTVILSVYHADGSVAIFHGGIEMGQGLNTKVSQVVAYSLGISIDKISIKKNNSAVTPNAVLTGGSIGSESVCLAAIKACKSLNERLAKTKASMPEASWENIVAAAYKDGINLQALGYVLAKTDLTDYDVPGVVIMELELDLLTGTHEVLRVDLMEDVGESLSPTIDIGQIEGAFVMGLGYWTCEELVYDKDTGACLTDRTWYYKPPGIKDIPIDFRVSFRRKAPNPVGVLRSKTTGEPALVLSVVVIHALREAVKFAREESGRYSGEWINIECPCTPENVMNALEHKLEDFILY